MLKIIHFYLFLLFLYVYVYLLYISIYVYTYLFIHINTYIILMIFLFINHLGNGCCFRSTQIMLTVLTKFFAFRRIFIWINNRNGLNSHKNRSFKESYKVSRCQIWFSKLAKKKNYWSSLMSMKAYKI